MIQDNQQMYSLTVGEFKELSKVIAIDNSYLQKPSEPKQEAKSDIIFIDEVILLTGYKRSTIYTKVCKREIPVISSGRPSAFSREEIIQWLKDGRPTVAEMMANEFTKLNNKKK